MNASLDGTSSPHRRYNPLTGEWVLVSPHRTARPWLGDRERTDRPRAPAYDPECYLCPGNPRVGGVRNPDYRGTLTFRNDFPALLPGVGPIPETIPLLTAEAVAGDCWVICYSHRHDLRLAHMSNDEILTVVDLWADASTELFRQYPVVQVFENNGASMGASNPHPHGQIWALDMLPTHVAREAEQQAMYRSENGADLLSAYQQLERSNRSRVVVETEHWLVVVPFWGVWPFETMVIPSRPVGRIAELDDAERRDLAAALGSLLRSYDALFDSDFPYSMGWHQRPDGVDDGWVLHAHFNPPLLRSATVRKYMVGFEMFGESQRDITAETAAERLRQTIA